MHPKAAIQKIPRSFLPADYIVTDWNSLEPYFKELAERPLNNKADLSQWLQDLSELEAVVMTWISLFIIPICALLEKVLNYSEKKIFLLQQN